MAVLILSTFESCTSTNHIQGSYTNVYFGIAGKELKFSKEPNTFEYYSRTEGALRAYSSGTWIQDKKLIFLSGYDNKNINILKVKSNIKNNQNRNRNKVIVQYKDNPLDTFIKVDIVVNRNYQIRIPGDTTFFVDKAVKTLRIKSYLVHEGLLFAASPLLDTLYSPEIAIVGPSKNKLMLLKVNVSLKDFFRVKLTDTLTIKNRGILVWNNEKFKKIKK